MDELDFQGSKWILVVLGAVIAVCLGVRDGASSIAQSKASIDAARSAGAARFAPQRFDDALDKFDRARSLHHRGHERAAVRLAEQAAAEARAAQAIAAAARSHDAAIAAERTWPLLLPVIDRQAATARPGG